MSILISDSIIRQSNISEQDLKIEIAVMLYQKNIFTLGKSSEFCEMHQIAFQKMLAQRGISINYDQSDFASDIDNLKNI